MTKTKSSGGAKPQWYTVEVVPARDSIRNIKRYYNENLLKLDRVFEVGDPFLLGNEVELRVTYTANGTQYLAYKG